MFKGWIDKDTLVGGVDPEEVRWEIPETEVLLDVVLVETVELREYGTCVT